MHPSHPSIHPYLCFVPGYMYVQTCALVYVRQGLVLGIREHTTAQLSRGGRDEQELSRKEPQRWCGRVSLLGGIRIDRKHHGIDKRGE